MKKQNYKINNKKCPYCGGTFECLAQSNCRCGTTYSKDAGDNLTKTESPACPCPECVRILASQAR